MVPGPEAPDRLDISDVRVSQPSPFAATISWRTSLPVGTALAYGLRASPDALAVAESVLTEHRVQLSGLALRTSYRVRLNAIGPEGQEATSTLDVTTPALANQVHASIGARTEALLVDGEPFFPLMIWNQCPDDYARSLAVGINLFAEIPAAACETSLSLSPVVRSRLVWQDVRAEAAPASSATSTRMRPMGSA